MKKQLPLLLGLLVGAFAVAEFYIPAHEVSEVQERLLTWGQILAAAAFVLGGINVMQVNWPVIRRRESDWQFKIILLASALIMGVVGVKWHEFGGARATGTVTYTEGAPAGQSIIRVKSKRDNALVSVDGAKAAFVHSDAGTFELVVEPGAHKVLVNVRPSGYGKFEDSVFPRPGQIATVETDLPMHWGPSGRVYLWMYDHVFYPCNATMFALLAFFIASAAFRAFRARNTEAALLLGAAILVMIGRVPVGAYLHDWFPLISDWIVDIPNNAGRRAIMMGAALGAIVTGLRVILGMERSHLGAD